MTRIRNTPARPKIGKAHEELIPEIQAELNNTLVTYNSTDIVRLALEELWKRAKKTDKLPKAVMAFHKVYQDDSGLMYIPLKT
jgi:hypothetical protein